MKTSQNITVDVFHCEREKQLYIFIEEDNTKCTVQDIVATMQDLIKNGFGDYQTKRIDISQKEESQKPNKKIILTNGIKFWGVE